MASHIVVSKRIDTIRQIMVTYKGLTKIPESSETWREHCLEVMAKYDISRRTANEYLKVAKQKLKFVK